MTITETTTQGPPTPQRDCEDRSYGGNACTTWKHGRLESKGWLWADIDGRTEVHASLHACTEGATVEAHAVTDFVVATVAVPGLFPGDPETTLDLYLSPVQAQLLALDLARAGTEAHKAAQS